MQNRKVVLHVNVTGTTNINKQGVVEIDAVELVDGKEEKSFHKIINPQRPISKVASEYHGLTNHQSEVKKAPTFDEIALTFLAFVKNASVIMQASWLHHVLNMDLERSKKKHMKYQCKSVDYIGAMFKELHPDTKSIKLDDIAEHYNVEAKTEIDKMVSVVKAMTKEKSEKMRPRVKDEVPYNQRIGLFAMNVMSPKNTSAKTTTVKVLTQVQDEVPHDQRIGLYAMNIR